MTCSDAPCQRSNKVSNVNLQMKSKNKMMRQEWAPQNLAIHKPNIYRMYYKLNANDLIITLSLPTQIKNLLHVHTG